jgi:ATP-binding cassette subfamily B protein
MLTTAPPSKVFPFIGHVLRHCGRRGQWCFAGILLLSVMTAVAEAFVPYAYKLITNAIVGSEHGVPSFGFAIGLLAGLMIGRTLLYRLRGWLCRIGYVDLLNFARLRLFDYLTRHSQQFFQDHFAGALANQIRQVAESINNILMNHVVQAFLPIVVQSTVGFFLLFAIAPVLAYSLLGWLVALLLVVAVISYNSIALNYARSKAYSTLSAGTVDAISNVSSVHLFAAEGREKRRYTTLQDRLTQHWRRANLFDEWIWGIFDGAVALLTVGFAWLIYQLYQKNGLTAGDVGLILVLTAQMFSSACTAVFQITLFYSDYGTIEEGLSKITRPLDLVDAPQAKPLVVAKGGIVFDHVHFAYRSGRSVFEDLSLTIPAGQKVGLVGFSGAGKTTLCQLLLRNYDLNSGQIRIDGQDIAAVTQASLRQQIAVIPQDTSLFHRSLAENIAYGCPDASLEQVVAAAKAAEAHEFITRLTDGYDTLVGERGVKLSGGQRQRIAIARAILKNAPILLLDEATSALDSVTEHLIQTALHHAMAGRTTLVVAHRLATLTNLDRLIVLEQGRVIEDGTLSQLLAQNGRFAQLWNMQAGGLLPDMPSG